MKALDILIAMRYRFCWAILLIATGAVGLPAQTLELFTTSSGGTKILLMWSPDTVTPKVRYNIYRKEASEASWPSSPLNPAPIGRITNCSQFKAIISPSSDLWTMLSYSLADSTGGVPAITPLANVCSITSFAIGSEKWRRVQFFAGYEPDVAQVMGQGWLDNVVSFGKKYAYRVVRVNSDGKELKLRPESEASITAGTPGTIPTPSGLQGVAGDSKVQLYWDIPASNKFQSFEVRRATAPGGPWTKVSDVEVSSNLTTTINLDTLVPSRHGFTDYERYDTDGEPISHPVPNPPGADISVSGPYDGTTYYYRVRHKDPLGNVGSWSANVSATPQDSTRPGTPQGISVTAIESMNGFQIRWNRVTLDVEGHKEAMEGYRVYRYLQTEDPNSGATAVGGLITQLGGHQLDNDLFRHLTGTA